MSWSAYLGATLSFAAGLLGLLFPGPVSRTVGVALPGRLGTSEFRATYGGFFLGAGSAVLLLASREAAFVLGLAWLGAAAARLLSVVVDRSRSRRNVAGLVIELVIGVLLIL